jgi:Flp pilus assembly protein TadG
MLSWRGRGRDRGRDGGSASAELVTATVPVAVLLLVFMMLVGRGVTARMDVDAAAAAAARAASLERTAEAAHAAATDSAITNLGDGRVGCRSLTVDVDDELFEPGGSVTVTVTCLVDRADLAMPGVPGTTTLQASASSPIDRWRGVP